METEDAEQEKDNNSSRTLALIDDFIDDGGFQLPKLDVTADAELEYKPAIDDDEVNSNSETTENSGIFTETLARIYIKQGKYERAHEIIERLYHKQPNKSAYYTDQMRFLEKLIINSKIINNKIKMAYTLFVVLIVLASLLMISSCSSRNLKVVDLLPTSLQPTLSWEFARLPT